MEGLLHGYENPMDSPLGLVQPIEIQGLTAKIDRNSVWNFGLEIIEDGHLLLRVDQSHHQASRIGQHGKPVIQCVARGGIHQIECFSGFVRLPELSGTDR